MTDKQREEWIEKKAREFVIGFLQKGRRLGDINQTEVFIRTLLDEAPKPKMSRELIKKHSVHMSINTYYDADDQKQGKTPMFERPRVENALIKFVEEAGFEVEE